MAIRLPKSKRIKRYPSAPKAGGAEMPKPLHLRPFLPRSLGQCWPGHWPGQPGPNLGEPGPHLGPPGSACGPPAPELGVPLRIEEVAALIGCSPWTVRNTLIPQGLPHFRFNASGRLTFYMDQVIRWIERQQKGGS